MEDDIAIRSIRPTDCLMSGLAIFGLKYPTLLQFDQNRNEALIHSNLRSLYGIERAPSDTRLLESLDDVAPEHFRGAYSRLIALLQRGNGLDCSSVLDGHYLLSIDGKGSFFLPRRFIAKTAERNTIATAGRLTIIRCSVPCWCIPSNVKSFLLRQSRLCNRMMPTRMTVSAMLQSACCELLLRKSERPVPSLPDSGLGNPVQGYCIWPHTNGVSSV